MPAGAGGPATGTLPRPADGRGDTAAPDRRRLALAHPARRRRRAACSSSPSPATTCPPCAVLGPAALALAVRGQRFRSGLWLGLVFGLAFFVPLLSWTGIYVGPFPWLALAVWEAVHIAVLGAATALTARLRLWPLWTAALWVADEALRGRFVLDGFPWGRLGFSQTDGPFLALAAYGGVPLVTFAVALTGTLLAAAVLTLVRARGGVTPTQRGPVLRAAALLVAAALASPWPACSPGCPCPHPRSPREAPPRPWPSSRATSPVLGWTSTPSAARSSTTTSSAPSSWRTRWQRGRSRSRTW